LIPLPPRPDLGGSEMERGRRGLARVPKVTWTWWESILLFFVGNVLIGQVLVAGLIFALAGVAVSEEPMGVVGIAATIAVDLVFVGAIVWWMTRRHAGWLESLGLPEGSWPSAAASGFGLGLLLYPIVTIGVGLPLTALFAALSGESVQAPAQLPEHLSLTGKFLAVVLAVLVAPTTEELFFRGLLFRSIRDRYGFWPGALVSSVIFGLVHYVPSPWQDAVLLQSVMVFTGLGLAWIYERRGTIVANIGAHTAFNVIGLVLIFSGL
jgi:membrane protease YdiL (CAAX protease family)